MPKKLPPLPGHHPGVKRNYQGENERYNGTPDQVANRSSRNKARRKVEAKLGHKLPTGLEVDHQNSRPRDDNPANLKVMTRFQNRSKGNKPAKGSK